ncbi:long-chain specific acyl-CoA dehydrogenase, mitochondrial [Sphaeroforma arctica JP610]|uniref:Isobutyryl-CoA dehydrogenase, mitochondrial n=1 Tax=Sphaeroforma arctica JP610 TaxID=667725 RepID=A0A0L0GDY5_9EUKA|nr:long-chain specific acyl-CoA dehydrogenase, mitochondrial [Sphaeroforma arctica JP610]KNC87081.1 long-chain specific acyl-CoA dehydrogenase, mitochondrial [Sphaeroforma arctica JP610]|eukprot:XP_014160983.1 long-chain specific acyl-CoA dehydrogenase, mitochondrial [Sphaeroforma arctica JP610]
MLCTRQIASRTLALRTARCGLSSTTRWMSSAAEESESAKAFRVEPHSTGKMTDLGTRRIFNEEHDMFRETARKYFDEECKPHTEKWEAAGMVDRSAWLKAGELGLLGCTTPAEYGGSDCDAKYAAIVWEEQAYSLCTGPGFALHSDIVMPYINHYGSEAQKSRILPKMASGEFIGAIAMTEPAAGSDLAGMKTTALKNEDGTYSLNGSKVFITNGAMADVTIVCAKTAPEKGPHGISLFLVETGMPGFERGKNLSKMGMKAQDTSELFFENVQLTEANLLGKENHGFYYLMQELPQERLLIADMGVAAAEAVFELTRDYVKERKAFGKPLVALQTIRHKLAELKTDICQARSFIDNCIELHSIGKLDTATASMAKVVGTDLQHKVADECVQLHGGWGYMSEYPVCKAFLDGRVQKIYGGTNEIMKEVISRDIVA